MAQCLKHLLGSMRAQFTYTLCGWKGHNDCSFADTGLWQDQLETLPHCSGEQSKGTASALSLHSCAPAKTPVPTHVNERIHMHTSHTQRQVFINT